MSAATLTKTEMSALVAPSQFDLFGETLPDVPAVPVPTPAAVKTAPSYESSNVSAPSVRTEPDAAVLEPAGVELGDGAATRQASLERKLTRYLAAEMTKRAKNAGGRVYTEADAEPWVRALFSVLFERRWGIWTAYPVCSQCREIIEKARADFDARRPENEARAARMIAENAEATKRHLAQMENRQ